MATLFTGTSGFAYPSWKPGFYPPKLPAAQFLRHYASRLNCVEINYTFRRIPSETTLEGWVNGTPPGFVFAVKAHQRITHAKRLKDAEEPTEYFLKALEPLRSAGRLGPILFQLPPYLKRDTDRLASYLESLPAGLRYAVEFRDGSWFDDEVYDVLRRYNVSLCVAESETLEVPKSSRRTSCTSGCGSPSTGPTTSPGSGAVTAAPRDRPRHLPDLQARGEPDGALEAEQVLSAA